MRSGLRLLVGYLCQVGGNSYLRCWPRNVVLSRATRAFSILLPFPLPSRPPPFFFFPPTSNVCLCALSRANGDHVFTTRSMISPRLETMHRVGELELCKGVSIGRRIDRFLSSILLYAHPMIDVHHENQDRRYFM